MLSQNTNNWLVPLVVVGIVGCTLYMAVKNNNFDVVNSMATAIVGYFFGTMRNTVITGEVAAKSQNAK